MFNEILIAVVIFIVLAYLFRKPIVLYSRRNLTDRIRTIDNEIIVYETQSKRMNKKEILKLKEEKARLQNLIDTLPYKEIEY